PPPQAVCCGDHQHCCPRGYTCNVTTETCEKLLAPPVLLGLPKTGPRAPSLPPALLRAAATTAHPGATVPCDATRSCHSGQRCCRSRRGGTWGCCPFAQGTCCSTGRCCPAGSRCAAGGWGCTPQRWDLL
ncbi:GRN protein, partial [Crotophaga sulcirostris]|nr:GRN protein [Crotophaga sulcirostris]